MQGLVFFSHLNQLLPLHSAGSLVNVFFAKHSSKFGDERQTAHRFSDEYTELKKKENRV